MQKNKWLFTKLLEGKSSSRVVAYLGVLTAFFTVVNFLEISISTDVQLSLTMAVAMLIGILVGPIFGGGVCFLGDAVGFLLNPKGSIYMIWVGLSVAAFAFLAGVIFHILPSTKKGNIWWKLVLLCISSFLICTVGINSTGFYFYNRAIGFSQAVENFVTQKFGGGVFFWGYVVYRLFFKLQIIGSLINYALLFLILPILLKIDVLKLKIS